jgi:hypothetical protein
MMDILILDINLVIVMARCLIAPGHESSFYIRVLNGNSESLVNWWGLAKTLHIGR